MIGPVLFSTMETPSPFALDLIAAGLLILP
jgi:hypothetical protein